MATKFVGGSYLSLPNVLGNVACWYKFWDPTTLEQTIGGGGGNPGNGNPIGRALDQSGNGLHLDAPSTGARPTFQTNVNGTASAALFDGSNDQLERLTLSNIASNRTALTVIASVRHAATPTGREVYALLTTGSNTTARIEHGTASVTANRHRAVVRRTNGGGADIVEGSIAVGNTMAIGTAIADYNTDAIRLYTNGELSGSGIITSGTSGAPTQTTDGRIYVGGAGTAYMNGHIFEIICLHAAPTLQELHILWNYMRANAQIG